MGSLETCCKIYVALPHMYKTLNVQNLECTKMSLQILNIQSLQIQNLECKTSRMYKHLNVQKLECTNLICTKPWMYKSHLYKTLNAQISFVQSLEYNFCLKIHFLKLATYPGIHAIAACPVEPKKSVWLHLVSRPTKHNQT